MLAFLFTKIGAWVVGTAVIVALVGGGYWYVKHLQGKVATLEEKVAGLELRAEVVEKAQKKTDEFMKTKAKVVKKNVQQKAQIDTTVESGDDPGMRQLYINHGLLKPPKADNSTGGGSGRPGNIPGRPASLQPLN